MKTRFLLITALMLGLIATAVSVPGCSTLQGIFQPSPPTPKTRAAQLETDYNAVLKVLVDARKLGKISDADYAVIESHRKNAAAALDLIKIAANSGTENQAALDQFRTALDAMITAQTKVNQ